MSKKISESIVSNEDLINELTKDLESSLLQSDNKDAESSPSSMSPEPSVMNEDDRGDSPLLHPDFHMDSNRETDKKNNDFNSDHFDDKDDKSDDSDDDVDDVALKDFEVTLTDEEKENQKIKAEKFKIDGNDRFKLKEYTTSIECYTEGLKICPLKYPADRAMLYSNRAAAKMKLDKNKEAAKDCTKAIELDPNYVKAIYRRAQCNELTDNLDECLADFNRILELDPSHQEARRAVLRLPPLIEARNEKLKTEMFGKLKDLGNLLLRPFGLSTDNFQVQQDPESKGYSINFTQGGTK